MMKWVVRKHPKMSKIQAVSKYIVTGKTTSTHKWVWGIKKANENKVNNLVIFNLSETNIIIRPLYSIDKNPYLLENKTYFQKRLIRKNLSQFREAIYMKFDQLCPYCKESLHNGEQVDLHHIKSVKNGGEYSLTNIQPLHQTCHISITHSKKIN
jgi:RNA-directed DNA polymerase